jgi:hypothetical protein
MPRDSLAVRTLSRAGTATRASTGSELGGEAVEKLLEPVELVGIEVGEHGHTKLQLGLEASTKLMPGLGQHHLLHPSIALGRLTSDQAAMLEPIDDANDVRRIAAELKSEGALRTWLTSEQQHPRLGRSEVELSRTGVVVGPNGLDRDEQLRDHMVELVVPLTGGHESQDRDK